MPHSQLFSKLACISVAVAFIGDMVLLPAILRVAYRDKQETVFRLGYLSRRVLL